MAKSKNTHLLLKSDAYRVGKSEILTMIKAIFYKLDFTKDFRSQDREDPPLF